MSDKLKSIQLVDRLDGAPHLAPGRGRRQVRQPVGSGFRAGDAREGEQRPAGAQQHAGVVQHPPGPGGAEAGPVRGRN